MIKNALLPNPAFANKTEHRIPVDGIRYFSPEYDRQWYPHATGKTTGLEEWLWWEGPPHGPSCYHIAKPPYKVGDELLFKDTWGGLHRYTVTKVTVGRVQEVKDKEAVAEGVEPVKVPTRFTVPATKYRNYLDRKYCDGMNLNSAAESFQTLWRKRYGLISWERNTWTWIFTLTPQ